MKFATLFGLTLGGLASLAATNPISFLPNRQASESALYPHKALDIRAGARKPAHLTWHSTVHSSGLANSHHHHNHDNNNNGGLPSLKGNVTACSNFIYDNVSTSRTTIYRDDCYELLEQLQALPGFWSLWKWRNGNDTWHGLASSGTCEVAVQRLDHGDGASNATSSHTIIIGNQDVVNILNASVFDFAAAADEPFVDNERSQGHMNCKNSFASNATLEFRIQLAEQQ